MPVTQELIDEFVSELTDIESHLEGDDYAHGIPMCRNHRTERPIVGSIVEVLCKRLIRWTDNFNSGKKKCPDCETMHGTFNCHFCGREIYG
jgi:hypothetical protein